MLNTPCSTFLAWHYYCFCYSLFNVPCSTLLLLLLLLTRHCLLNIAIVFADLCLTLLLLLLVWHWLFDVAFLVFFAQRYCCSLFDATSLALLVDVDVVIATPYSMSLFFFCYSLLNITINYSLFNATTLIVIPCLTMLFFLLFLAQCCCSSWYSLLNIVASLIAPCLTLLLFLMIFCSFILNMACSGTSLLCLWCCYSLLVVPCSTFLFIFLLFQISIHPL